MASFEADGDATTYDLRGLKCPLPVLKTRRRLRDLPAGARLMVLTSDPLAVIDIPHLCREDGHALFGSAALPDAAGHRFLIAKATDAREADGTD
ncbi:response regulator SirA [Rhizobium rhizosphaerae]|uniref:Response regulator SirA n=1 Tax=Xaviernesmea rhizosphaerae TaxID=1672749 RepID=A0ABX3PBF2_9HYPH|nr:sulfurtransferase TusA family protein [Xaviernesmea rhizosphaerae]OQP85306.1 response regulator SirA [Xaviernesmea rhizosphaerae]